MKRVSVAILGLLLVLGLSTVAYAGPGSVVIKTEGDITATFGAQVRMIPTYEQDWDFGIAKKTNLPGAAIVTPASGSPACAPGGPTVIVVGCLLHSNEAGNVNKSYIRSEDRLYFNFAKGDIWDVYINLEFDDVLSSRTADRVRDVQGFFGTFGLEHLQASVKLPWIYSRFNAGWIGYGVDQDLGVLIYLDDDPGFWLTGGVANFGWKIGYHKKLEANRTLQAVRGGTVIPNIVNTGSDNDRDILSSRFDYTITKDTQVGLIFVWNAQHGATANFVTADPCVGPTCPETDDYWISPFVKASFAGFKFVAQYAHLWGDANKTRITNAAVTDINNANYKIDSNAVFADLAFDLAPWTGFRFIPHVGVWWTQGDKDPNDNKLEGYDGATAFQRFNPAFGGENTIIADGNTVYGTPLYSFFPDQRGNQNSGLAVGGTGQNGRGDNPGILIVGGGITVDPIKNWTYRTNAMYLRYQEKFCLTSPAGACAPTSSGAPNLITSKDAGVEWDNEVLWWLDKNMVVKGQFSFLFPGDGIKQITKAIANNGTQPDDTAIRLALEIIWNF